MNIVFIASDSSSLVGGRELVDQWGMSFFFQTVSGTNMEVRSYGHDLQLWTEDDIVMGEGEPLPQ